MKENEALANHDPVATPQHYTRFNIETLDIIKLVISETVMPQLLASGYWGQVHDNRKIGRFAFICALVKDVIKYCYRAPYKGDTESDLGKARFYMQRACNECLHEGVDFAKILDTVFEKIQALAVKHGDIEQDRVIYTLRQLYLDIMFEVVSEAKESYECNR